MLQEDSSIQQFDSQSIGGITLVGSDLSPVSPIGALWSADQSIPGDHSIVHAVDDTQWIRLDTVHPKLLQELLREHGDPEWDHKRPRSKNTSKVKAWVRQSPVGFVLRFRQKINESRDEVIDAELSPISGASISPNNVVHELSEAGIVEAPDTQVFPELPTESKRRDSTDSNYIWSTDPVPGYKANRPDGSGPSPTTEVVELPADLPNRTHDPMLAEAEHPERDRVSAHMSNKLLSTSRIDECQQDAVTCRQLPSRAPSTAPVPTNVNVTLDEMQQQQKAKEAFMSRVTLIMRSAGGQEAKQPKANDSLAGFKVVGRKRYETETDGEPSSLNGAKKAPSLRVRTSLSSLRRRKGASPRSKKSRIDLTSSDEGNNCHNSEDDPRFPRHRQSGPRTTPVSAGREAVLTALLRAQAEMLGPEHPLTCSARQKRPRTSKEWTRRRTSQLLVTLCKGESLAKKTLGQNHPHVEAFSADLATFEELLARARDSPDKAIDTIDRLDEQASSQSVSPIWLGARSEEDQIRDKLALSLRNSPTEVRPEIRVSSLDDPTLVSNALNATSESTVVPYAISASLNDHYGNEVTGASPMAPHPRSPITIITGQLLTAATSSLIGTLQWLQRNYGPEPALEPGKYRVRWTCSCGESLYDDYIELIPGAGRRLEALLNRPRTHTSDGHHYGDSPVTPISPNSSTDTGSCSASPISIPSSHTSWSSASAQQKATGSSSSSAPTIIAPRQPLHPYHPIPDPPYLLTCTSEDRYTTKMTHVPVRPDHITSDMKLAHALREHHDSVTRRRRWSWLRALRLRGLSGIEFVQFEVHSNRFADIRKCPDVPPEGGRRRAEYAFEADTLPPVGSRLLMHLFRHPEDYDRELVAYLRVPKRTAGRLQVGVGWGLHLVEDFLAERMAVMVGSLVFLASAMFAVAWACERNDVQGAFGVAQWMSGGAVFACGWVQLYVG